jgi:hypothetical protein
MSDECPQLPHLKKSAFLAAYADCGSIKESCQIAGINRRTYTRWMEDEAFRLAFQDAHLDVCDALEREARRRAMEGYEEPVFHKGEVVGHRLKFSDMLLAQQLNASMPEKYQRNQQQSAAPPSSTTLTPDQQVSMMDDTIPEAM